MQDMQYKPESKKKTRQATGRAIRISLIYLIFGCLWILLSDIISELFIKEPSNIILVSIIKGLFFVLVTAVLFFLFIYPALKKVVYSQQALENVNKELKETVDDLRESERSKSVLISHIPGIAYRCKYDKQWTMEFISDGCHPLTGYKAEELIYNSKISYNDLVCEEYREQLWNDWGTVISNKTPYKGEYEIKTSSGVRKWVLEMGQAIFDNNGAVEALEGIIIDIDEAKQHYNLIQYMNDHDFLTGLYNRKFFEEKMVEFDNEDNYPLTIIVADINGVRLINDAFGHAAGDELIKKTAEIIKKCCPRNIIVARTGGDEFGVLMPNTDHEECYRTLLSIDRECGEYNAIVNNKERIISLSVGSSIKNTPEQSINEVEKEAEDNLYKHKLLDGESHHNAIISSVMATMFARSQETEEHAQRLAKLSKMIGSYMNLEQKHMDDLQLLSMLHDIGKIGIDDHILNKPGKLTNEEWDIMKKHPQIGYRIAMSSPELKSVADYILYHHERWDGAGYPNGLSGESIPLLSRILAVADAYDAMTEDRVYRKALSKSYAVEEIKKNAGSQFDPQIVEIFISKVIASD